MLNACQSQEIKENYVDSTKNQIETEENEILVFQNRFIDTNLESISKGTVGNGSLVNSRLFPFEGKNFFYFDSSSYLEGRAFLNHKLLDVILKSYSDLELKIPKRQFGIMECSSQHGGKMSPHITHQNGLSVDFMTPLKAHDSIYSDLDKIGLAHYFLDFNNEGKYVMDNTIEIDFDAMAIHILSLNKNAALKGMKISKVILKTELLNDLFSTKYGQELKNSGIYFAQKLNTAINSLHDDHYHIDFTIKN